MSAIRVNLLKKNSYKFLSRTFVTSGISQNVSKLSIGIQSAPFDRGQKKTGVADGPDVIRSSGIIELLREIGHDVKDYGDIPFNNIQPRRKYFSQPTEESMTTGKILNVNDVASACQSISNSTAQILRDKRVCLTLGGETFSTHFKNHSIGTGTVHGASEVHGENLAVLWVDAHCDINVPNTSWSGNFHGMSMSFVIKELQAYVGKIPQFSWVNPRVSAANIAFIGIRDVDPAEKAILEKMNITAYSMREVDQFGISKITEMALDKITPKNQRPLHVSFDIDSLDDNEVTNTGTPVPGGLTLREGLTLLERVYETGNVVSMDLVEVNPSLGHDSGVKRTAIISKQLLASSFGYYRGGHSNGYVLNKT